MNRMAALWVAGAVVVGIIPFARGVGTPNTPPGIEAKNWIPMGDQAGFVVTGAANDYHDGLRSEQNVLKGYFMLQRKGHWLRVEPGPAAGVYPTDYHTTK